MNKLLDPAPKELKRFNIPHPHQVGQLVWMTEEEMQDYTLSPTDRIRILDRDSSNGGMLIEKV